MTISKIALGGSTYDLPKVTYGTTSGTACEGNDSRLSDSRPASDVYSWAKAASKPTYGYGEVGYNKATASVSGAVTVNGSTPVHELTATGNISSISFTTGVPTDGHSCHIVIKAASDYTAALSHGSTVTISSTTYTFKCPGAEDLSLSIKAGGYVELDLLRVGTNIYVRGV